MSEIKILKRKNEYLKGAIINQLQDEMYKRGFSYTEHNKNTIIDVMVIQTKNIMEEIVRNTEVLTSKITGGSGTNGSNLMDIAIE